MTIQNDIALRDRLREAEETLDAIHHGEVDAFVVRHRGIDHVLLLGAADRPYRLMVERMHQGAVTVAPTGVVLYANRRFCDLLRRPLDEVIGKSLRDLALGMSHEPLDALISQRTDRVDGPVELLDGAGQAVPLQVIATTVADEPGIVCLLFIDPAAGERDEALLTAETLARSMLEQAVDGIVVCDAEGRVLRASHSAREFALGNPLFRPFSDAFGLRGTQGVGLDLERVCQGEPVRSVEFTLAHRPCDLLVSAGPVRDPSGRLLGCVVTMTDITARKAVERALREADRRKDEFLAMLAHELRNSLAPTRNALDMLDRVGSRHPTAVQARAMMNRQVTHLVRLVDDLLDVSRIGRGKILLRTESVDVGTIVRWVLDSAGPLIAERGHRLEISLPVDPVVVEADPMRTSQAVLNLVLNAVKYTPAQGRIAIVAGRENDGAEECAAIRVRDDGIGIPEEMLPRIFDAFTQEHFEGRRHEGLGLGLTLARRLVELQGGRIEAFSEGLGRGSEFVIRLRLAAHVGGAGGSSETTRGPMAREDREEATPAPARRVLVVDDNHDAAESMRMLLQVLGHEARAAHDGQAALTIAADYRPEVVLLDLGMPGMDGYQLARALRAVAGLEQATLVALTGFGSDEHRQRALEAGIDHHLVKPVELVSLQNVIARRAGAVPVAEPGRAESGPAS